MHIKVNSEEELKDIAKCLLHLIVNLRHWQREWHEHRGAEKLARKHYWENRTDDYISKLGVKKETFYHDVHISIQSEE